MMPPRRKSREDDLQRAIVDLLFKAKPRALWFHVPNGGHRDKRTGAKLAGLGVRKGVPDLVFIGFDGLIRFMELKAEKGRMTPEQKAWREAATAIGIPFAVVRSLDEAVATLNAWGLLDAGILGSKAA